MISTLLIANRGEIALRVMRTAHRLGIRTVAVYSDADASAPHVLAADAAVRIGPTPASESYLNIDALLDAARRSGADAVHPGYGFLSERAEFARAVAAAGLTFVGPTGDVMDRMGRKDAAREIAVAAGVPVVPLAVAGDALSTAVGFPLLVKAAAGGGGKGMRIVREAADLEAAIATARREALSAFGDDTVLIEKYVESGRHVEVQVMADQHGNVVHLFERDCSAQRRHQKVIEEAPSPTISEDLRARLTGAAVALAAQVGYTNAGTVEFLVEGEEFYFLEMNTRLQVEHPVTEAITGLDLVEVQLRVASGEPLPFGQSDITRTGHAMEARVYAEDAFNGFLPQAGRAGTVRWSERARIDAALVSGQEVSTSYDPMLGKVIVHAATRETARRALIGALDDSAILGLTTNLGFLRALVDSEAFASAAIDTAWLDKHAETITPPDRVLPELFAAWAVAEAATRNDGTPFGAGDGWRSAGQAAPVLVELVRDGHTIVCTVDPVAGTIAVDDNTHSFRYLVTDGAAVRLEIDGIVDEATLAVSHHEVEVAYRGHTVRIARPDAFGPTSTAHIGDGSVTAPMPGTVLAVSVKEGDLVEAGAVLGVMEAMKMELTLKSPIAGRVDTVGCEVGVQVALGTTLFAVVAVEDSAA
jgi:3-methylcrotonyl-CoA carboxylase alpha subunit/acetyl-CoA/propionyl-CoA carboxylase biotin carboxyl carrier protein